jgi:hemoglobin
MALYDDLGGAPAIAAALDNFYPKVLADPKLSPFFAGVNIDKLKIRVSSFFAMATGGPNTYAGRGMPEAHAKLLASGLNDDVFDSFVGLFEGALRELGVLESNVAQVMALLHGARNDVLNR